MNDDDDRIEGSKNQRVNSRTATNATNITVVALVEGLVAAGNAAPIEAQAPRPTGTPPTGQRRPIVGTGPTQDRIPVAASQEQHGQQPW